MSQQDIPAQGTVPAQQDIPTMEESGQKHRMPIATTIGATIGLIGLVILLYGLFAHVDYSRSDGININFWWGLFMVVFGLLMGGGSFLLARRRAASH